MCMDFSSRLEPGDSGLNSNPSFLYSLIAFVLSGYTFKVKLISPDLFLPSPIRRRHSRPPKPLSRWVGDTIILAICSRWFSFLINWPIPNSASSLFSIENVFSCEKLISSLRCSSVNGNLTDGPAHTRHASLSFIHDIKTRRSSFVLERIIIILNNLTLAPSRPQNYASDFVSRISVMD